MTKAKFKKAMKEAMVKYRIDLRTAVKLALHNNPNHFEAIAQAEIEIIQDEMFN